MSECCGLKGVEQRERRLLWVVFSLNAIMFLVEFSAGWIAHSMGLLADSLDMLADSLVYAISLYAVGRSMRLRAKAAMTNGVLQLLLGLLVLSSVIRQLFVGVTPEAHIMSVISVMALLVNVICFAMLYRLRSGDINLKASWVCSRNDMTANVGVLLAAYLVSVTQQAWPDLLVGTLIAALVIYSSLQIIAEAKQALVKPDITKPASCGLKSSA
ncbi:MAG: cation transporter [Gammaproteobacteria bacterium]|nr:cation transporter [Gammaproteobacteria bacterium]